MVYIIINLIKPVFLFAYLFIMVLLTIWLERRMIGFMQQRLGPNRVGKFGLLQSLSDGVKLALKEQIIPQKADIPLFILAPILSILFAFILWLVIPLHSTFIYKGVTVHGALLTFHYSLLFILIITVMTVYGIFLAGLSSGSPYSFLGGIRSISQLISYELIITLSFLDVIIYTHSFDIEHIIHTQNKLWNIIPLFPVAILYLISSVAETNRLPFDIVESEGELVGGFHTEYSSLLFAFFFLAEYVNMFSAASIFSALFLGGYTFPFLGNNPYLTFIIFAFKNFLFIFLFIWLRGTLPRFRYDQVIQICWKILIPISILTFVLILGLENFSTYISKFLINKYIVFISGGVLLCLIVILTILIKRRNSS